MVSFNTLWANHPGWTDPCSFEHQCAVRMGVALEKSKVDLSTFHGARCWQGHAPKHILRAQELADWISIKPHYFGTTSTHKNVTKAKFSSKKGIVFIQNGWGATDHIDLWDGTSMKVGESEYFALGKEVWFWEFN